MKMKQNFRSMKAEKKNIDRQEIFPTRHSELKSFILNENGMKQKL